ncbi:hypothetical protein IWQ51_005794 [Labrenzia sp. EL_142]|nr:hypothetical protein [Labrenzia sp. EL_142]
MHLAKAFSGKADLDIADCAGRIAGTGRTSEETQAPSVGKRKAPGCCDITILNRDPAGSDFGRNRCMDRIGIFGYGRPKFRYGGEHLKGCQLRVKNQTSSWTNTSSRIS